MGNVEMGMSATATAEQTVAKSSDLWEQIKANLAAKITPKRIRTGCYEQSWRARTTDVLRVLVPDQVTKDFWSRNTARKFATAFAN